MPKYAVVIKDAKIARAKEIQRNLEANLKAHPKAPPELVLARVVERFGAMRPPGTVHAYADSACPEGKPNCRNCGDPAYAEDCKAKGHCPLCGTQHGLAPDSVVAASGYELIEQS